MEPRPTSTTIVQSGEPLYFYSDAIFGQKMPTPAWDKRINGFEGTGKMYMRDGDLIGWDTGGSAIKAGGAELLSLQHILMAAIGARSFPSKPGADKSDASAWVGTNGIGGDAKKVEMSDCEFTGCCTGSGYGTVIYVKSDEVMVRNCNFEGCGQHFYMPNLLTPASKPRIVFEDCTFVAGEYWYERVGGWWPSVGLTVHSAASLMCINCTWSGTWRHIFNYVNPANYFGYGNNYIKAKFQDANVAFGTTGGFMTLDAWCANAREVGVKR